MGARGLLSRRVARSFDAWAPEYDAVARRKIESRGYSYAALASAILEITRPGAGATLLEVGTGPGTLGSEVVAAGDIDLDGVDLSREMLAFAQKRGIYRSLARADAGRLPFGSDSADGLFSAFVFHSVFDKRCAFREAYRVLKTGTAAVIVDLFPVGRPRLLGAILGAINSARHECGSPSLYLPVEDYVRIALDSGFVITQVRRLGIIKTYTHYLMALRKEGDDDQ